MVLSMSKISMIIGLVAVGLAIIGLMIPGPMGPLGPKGNTGDTGPAGNTGTAGERGATGPQGLIGNSTIGPMGPMGPTGKINGTWSIVQIYDNFTSETSVEITKNVLRIYYDVLADNITVPTKISLSVVGVTSSLAHLWREIVLRPNERFKGTEMAFLVPEMCTFKFNISEGSISSAFASISQFG